MLCTKIVDFNFFNTESFSYRACSLHRSHKWWAFNYNFIEFHLVFVKEFFQKLTCKYCLQVTFRGKWWINSVYPSIISFIKCSICSFCMSNYSKEAMVLNTIVLLYVRFLILKKTFKLWSLGHWLTCSQLWNSKESCFTRKI